MKTLFKQLYTTVILSLLISVASIAQPSFGLYHLNSLGETNMLNPGHMPRHGFTLGIPMIYSHFQTPGITTYDIFRADKDDQQTVDYWLNNKDINFKDIGLTNEITPLFLGLKIRKNYFSLGANVVMESYFGIPKDFFGFFYGGNAGTRYFGQKVDLSGFETRQMAYGAIHGGYTREINDKLTLGVRVKYLRGLYYFDAKAKDAYLALDSGNQNAYRLTAYANYELQAAGYGTVNALNKPNASTNDIINEAYINKPLGTGWGFDLGANYKLNRKWEFSASVLDIGAISWENDAKNLKKEATYIFEGVQSTNADSFNTEIENIADSLGRLFEPNESDASFTTSLTTKIYLGAQYNLTPRSRLNATFYGDFFRSKFRPGLAIMYSQQVWRLLDLRVNYNIFNQTYSNVGAGVVLNLGPVQLYGMSDNLMASINPETSKYTNFRVGMNIAIGSNWDRDGDGIKDRKDDCKKIYGLAKYKGCPDTDGDGVADPDDKCPDVKGSLLTFGCPDADKDTVPDYADSCVNVIGLRSLNGCPDRDGDGIADKDDACPDLPGPSDTKGCPDDDKDGVINQMDSCPDVAGPAYLFGCPDSDGDSIPDKDDKCPNIKGSVLGKGCPDSDGDGIDDINDSCAMVPGLAKFNGCPDSDNDGIPNHLDKCPYAAGPTSNNGCPVVKQSVKKLFEKALTGIQFESGKDVIKKQSFSILNDVVKILKENPDYRLAISGHTDNTGDAAKNMELSKARAAAVKKYLTDNGIDFKRLSSEGYGDTKPVADNNTAAGRAKNRRVEFTVLFEDFVEVEPEKAPESPAPVVE